jgi:hypothetical protein
VTKSASLQFPTFSSKVIARIKLQPELGQALVREALTSLSEGEPEVARAILRCDVLPALGFEKIAAALNISPAALRKNLAHKANPGIDRFSAIVTAVSKELAKRKLRADKRKRAK